MALFGAQNRNGWGVGLTILTALANLLPIFRRRKLISPYSMARGAWRRIATVSHPVLGSWPDAATLKSGCGVGPRYVTREAAERTLLTSIAADVSPVRPVELRNQLIGANRLIWFRSATEPPANCRNCSSLAAACTTGLTTHRSPETYSVTIQPGLPAQYHLR